MARRNSCRPKRPTALDINLYFRNELLLMLERAGFADVVVHGEHTEGRTTSDDAFLVFVAKVVRLSGSNPPEGCYVLGLPPWPQWLG